ncbi:MAG: dienelactone hydrolase family protein [Novosphingobium sp.]
MADLETVAYRDGATALTGLLAQPQGTPRAAILVFPTIANANAAIERRARMLAEAGYLSMIADFYGEPVADAHAGQELAKALRANVVRYRARLSAALAALHGHKAAAGLPLAAIGYCMGGQAALELARSGADIAVAVSFHGILETAHRAQPGAIRARLLVCHGHKDPLAPRGELAHFEDEMDVAGAQWHLHVYSHARHGFTDPASDTRGAPLVLAYDPSADRQSWAAMLSLFDEVFE